MNIVSWLETLNGLGFKTAWVLLSLLWQSSILLAAAGLLAFVLRRKRASVRHAVWIIALLAAPALPLLAWVGSNINAPQREIPVMPSYSAPAVVSPAPPVKFPQPPQGQSTLPPPIALEAEEETRFSLFAYPWALAFIIYATGLILFLSLVVAGRLRIGRWIRKGNLVTDTDVLSAFEAAREHFGLKRRFLLVESEYVQAPMTIRTFRPVVLLPTGLTQNLSDAELRAVTIHEMAHIKRNDGLLLTLASFVRAVLFFHPLVWLACRQISLLAEQVADDAVLEATGEALPYAQMLARLAEGLTRRSLSTELAAGIVLSKSAFLRRVETILSDRRDQIRKLSRLALVSTILATVASLAIATALPLGEKSPAKVPAPEFKQVRYFTLEYDKKASSVWKVNGCGKLTFDGELGSPGGNFLKVYYSAPNIIDKTEKYDSTGVMMKYAIFKYDQEGNIIEIDRYLAYGDLFRTEKFSYDEKGRVAEVFLFGRSGKLWRTMRYKYDTEDKRMEMALYESEGVLKETLKMKVDDNGRVVESDEYGEEGQLKRSLKYKYDHAGRRVEYWGWYRLALLLPEGHKYNESTTKYEYNDKGWLLAQSTIYTLDAGGKLSVSDRYKYTEDGKVLENSYTAVDGGKHIWIYKNEYDDEGRIVETTEHFDGRLSKITKYNEFQRRKESIRYDKEGKISQRRKYEYDEKGRQIKTRHYGPDGKLIEKEDTGGEGKGAKVPEESAVRQKSERPVGDEAEEVEKAVVVVKDARDPFGWKATLPNGVTVELLGISYNPSEGEPWWRPDGSPLAEAPSNAFKDRLLPDERSRAYEFVTRVTGVPEKEPAPTWQVIPGPSTLASSRPYEEGKPLNFTHWAAVFPKDQESFALRVRMPTGPWVTRAVMMAPGGSGVSGGVIVLSQPNEVDGQLAVTVSNNIVSRACRIVLVDVDGRTHKAKSSSGSSMGEIRQATFYFEKLPLEEVKEFRFQTRPYQWVEFRNISLRPLAATRNNEPAWGEAVEGVQVRLRAEKQVWTVGEVPTLKVDVRNSGKRNLLVPSEPTPTSLSLRVLLDDDWYYPGPGRYGGSWQTLGPHRQLSDIAIGLGLRWRSLEDSDAPLRLTPGKHTIRVGMPGTLVHDEGTDVAAPWMRGGGVALTAISNPVEITIERTLPGSRDRGKVAQPAEDKDSPNTDLFSGESSTGRRIFGLVVDTEGRPVSGARVRARSYTSGQLMNATMLHTHTDEDGRFDVVVPFPDARYTLEICKGGFSKTSSVFSGDGREIKLVLKTGPTHVLTGTVKDAETGAPARDTRVLLIGEYGFRGDVKTDETGRFEIQGVPNYIGQAVLYVRTDGRISPLRLVRGRDKYVEVGLGLPARLKGIVKEELSGKPLAGCTVTAKPWFASAFSIQTTTGDDGRFELTGLPPGKYEVGASSDNYYEPPTRGDLLERPDVPLNPGVTQFYQIALREKATVKGQVLGPDGRPATDAVVGMRATWDMDSVKQWCTARIDKQGRFILRSGRLHRRETAVEAFSSWYGSGRATVEGLVEGETRENVTIRLSGAARVRGVVTDLSGVPLKNISVQKSWQGGERDVTDEEGRFDLGRIALPTSKHTAEIKFRSPRPHRGDLHMWRDDGSRRPAMKPGPGARFFHHKSVPFEATHGEDVDLEVALEPTEVLTFSGRVFDHAGGPVPGASVMLFAGNASRETLRSTLHPHFKGKGLVVARRRAIPLCLTITDDKGKWAMWAVRETEESFKIKHWSPPNAPCYSVGVEGPEGYSTIVTDIVFEKGQTEQAIEISLGKPPAEETISGRVVDTNGNPLSGIQLRVGVPTRVVTTGADGGFVFANPGAGKVTISVRTKGWSVVSPEPGRARGSFEVVGGKDRVRKVRVVLGEDGSVSGTVRWESGKPVVTYTVSTIRHRLNVSNAQGVFRLEGFPPGEHFLSVRTPEGVYGLQQIKVKPGASVETEVMLPFPEYTIRGRVTDATGAAVAGVTVTLSGKRCDTEALNDEDGRFTFRVPAGSYILTTSADLSKRTRDRKRTKVKVGGDVKEVEVRLGVSLPQPGHFKLRLIDRENRPLPGIKIYDAHRTYSTDVDGWCVVWGLAPKRYIFWVSDEEQLKNEHMRLTVHIEGSKTTTLEIRLGEGFRVSGRVMCASEPVRNVRVWMSTEDGRRNSAAHTEPDGRFQFINLPEGRLSVKCTPYETNQPVTESLDIQGDVDDLVIHLPTGRILGRLLDYRGRALPGCEVRVTCLDEPAESRRQFTRRCDDGQLDLKYLKDGKYLLELMQDRSALASYGPVTISDGETLRGIVIQEPGESSEAEHPPATQPAAKSEETAPTEAPASPEPEEIDK